MFVGLTGTIVVTVLVPLAHESHVDIYVSARAAGDSASACQEALLAERIAASAQPDTALLIVTAADGSRPPSWSGSSILPDNPVRSTEVLVWLTGAPNLGAITHDLEIPGCHLTGLGRPNSARAEVFRRIRSNFWLVDVDRQRKSTVVTSAMPGEQADDRVQPRSRAGPGTPARGPRRGNDEPASV